MSGTNVALLLGNSLVQVGADYFFVQDVQESFFGGVDLLGFWWLPAKGHWGPPTQLFAAHDAQHIEYIAEEDGRAIFGDKWPGLL